MSASHGDGTRSSMAAHPILGNFVLPVEVLENATKLSGTQNLMRTGWNEDRCRAFLIRLNNWVPRNFNYEDGLRLLHPLLQTFVGDENMDLALGVLEELIEIEEHPPFPGCVFQRWKHHHLHRREHLALPHTPHTTTIVATVVPTPKLAQWRAQHPLAPHLGNCLSPRNDLKDRPIFSSVAHRPVWKIEHTMFVSLAGERAGVFYSPTPEELHRRYWDPVYGKAGIQSGGKKLISLSNHVPGSGHPSLHISEHRDVTEASHPPTEDQIILKRRTSKLKPRDELRPGSRGSSAYNLIIQRLGYLQQLQGRSGSRRLSSSDTENQAQEQGASSSVSLNHSPCRNVALPPRFIPSAIFARKHEIVLEGEILPLTFLRGWYCESLDQKLSAWIAKLLDESTNEVGDAELLDAKRVLAQHNFPASPGLFFDAYDDFKWPINHQNSPAAVASARNSPDAAATSPRSPSSLRNIQTLSDATHSRDTGGQNTLFASSHAATGNGLIPVISRQDASPRNFVEAYMSGPQLIPPHGQPRGERGLTPMTIDDTEQTDHDDHEASCGCCNCCTCGLFGFFQRLFSSKKRSSPVEDRSRAVEASGDPHQSMSPWNTEAVLVDRVSRPAGVHIASSNHDAFEFPSDSNHTDIDYHPHPHGYGRPYMENTTYGESSNGRFNRREAGSAIDSYQEQILPSEIYRHHLMSADQGPSQASEHRDGDDYFSYQHSASHWGNKPLPALPGGFDGSCDERDFVDGQGKTKASHLVNRTSKIPQYCHRNRATVASMDLSAYDHLPPYTPSIPPPEPLHIHKHANEIRIKGGAQRINDNITQDNLLKKQPIYPVRSSSLRRGDSSAESDSYSPYCPTEVSSDNSGPDLRSPLSEIGVRLRSETSSDIMGDFIPLGHSVNKNQPHGAKREISPGRPLVYSRVTANAKRYEFEPGTPLFDDARISTITNLVKNSSNTPSSSPYLTGLPNENTRAYTGRKPTPIYNPPTKSSSQSLHRSESSPVISQSPVVARRNSTPNMEQYPFHHEDDRAYLDTRRGRRSEIRVGDQVHKLRDRACHSPVRGHQSHQRTESISQASTFSQRSRHADQASSISSLYGRSMNHSPSKALDNVAELAEFDDFYPGRIEGPTVTPSIERARLPMKKMFGEHGWLSNSPDPASASDPPKRSSSPMKKMFGERGWIGQSPAETRQIKSRLDKSSNGGKKVGFMEKLKNKIDEFNDKADLNFNNGRPNQDKYPKLALLSISLSPPEQARTLMEVELMLVHTANTFIMNEFCQGRVSVDSIKKAVDSWKSKGRPAVIEFMYDQATQRELVAANQHNFRFHGERAADPLRIASTLYSWKRLVSVMAVRTFCSPDTVILKLLLDIGQVLELLGGVEPIMLRLQQIRATSNEIMRVARIEQAAREVPQGKAQVNDPAASHEHDIHGVSMEDGYRSMMLVPESSIEKNVL